MDYFKINTMLFTVTTVRDQIGRSISNFSVFFILTVINRGMWPCSAKLERQICYQTIVLVLSVYSKAVSWKPCLHYCAITQCSWDLVQNQALSSLISICFASVLSSTLEIRPLPFSILHLNALYAVFKIYSYLGKYFSIKIWKGWNEKIFSK